MTFSEEMDAASINAGTLSIKPDTGFPLAATVTYNAETKTATLDPAADLVAGKTYFVTVSSNAKSTSGVGLDGGAYTWYFRTVDNTPPRVVSKSPVDGAVKRAAESGDDHHLRLTHGGTSSRPTRTTWRSAVPAPVGHHHLRPRDLDRHASSHRPSPTRRPPTTSP